MNAYDFRLAWRSTAREPAVSGAIVITLGLAVAATAALFSVFDGLVARPLPFKDAERIVHFALPLEDFVQRMDYARDGPRIEEFLAQADFLHDRTRVADTSAFDEGSAALVDWRLAPTLISSNFFSLFGVQPLVGRPFAEEEARAWPRPVMLGFDLWQVRFGADPDVVGRIVDIPGSPEVSAWRIAGVMPRGFEFPAGTNFWIATSLYPSTPRIPTFARLAAKADIERLAVQVPSVKVTPLRDFVRPEGASALAVVLGASGLLLLIAWIQAGSLLLARAAARVDEAGVRLAIGSSRSALLGQLWLEAAMIGVTALVLGWLVAPAFVALIIRALPPEMTAGQHVVPDIRVFLFACALSAIGLVLFSLPPALVIRRASPAPLLRGGFADDSTLGRLRLRILLVVGQIGLATTLLYASGLILQSFSRVVTADVGFAAARLTAVTLPNLSTRGMESLAARAEYERYRLKLVQTVERLRAVRGVARAASTDGVPMDRRPAWPNPLQPEADRSMTIEARTVPIGLGYPKVLGVPLIQGAEPSQEEADAIGSHGVGFALANVSLARRLERYGPVVGQHVYVTPVQKVRITGILQDFRIDAPQLAPGPLVFVYGRGETGGRTVLVRLDSPDAAPFPAMQAVLRDIWGDRMPREFTHLSDLATRAVAEYRARALIVGLVALACFPLTMIGVGTTLLYAVRLQRKTTAIHLVFGADARLVQRRTVLRALAWSGAGAALGLVAGIVAGRVMAAYLFGIPALHSPTAAAVVSLVVAAAGCGAAWPAREVRRVDVATLLREA